MRTLILVAGFTLMLTVPAFAVAGQPAIVPIDLSSAGGPSLWLRCTGETVERCGIASLWMQSNGLKGLQTTIYSHGSKIYDPDMKLTP